MALQTLKFRPGVNTQATPTLLEAGWSQSQLIRFRDGMLQKIGGWARATPSLFQGICRGLHSWTQLNGTVDMGVGTHLKLFLFQNGSYFDLTPVRLGGTSSSNFYTSSNGVAAIGVNIASHGASVGDFFEALVSATANGVTIFGEYQIASVVDANNFTITASSNATASGSFGNGVNWQLLLPIGLQDTGFVSPSGYGTGGYGTGAYGGGSGAAQLCRLWFIDNWGEFVLACPQNGGIYQWQPSSGTATRASVLTNAPLFSAAMFVSAAAQQVISLGSEAGGTQDPMLVRFSDVGNNATWTASATNQAGSFRLSRGSKIMGALGSALSNLIWTNEGLWLMQYIGSPLVYSFVELGFKCGLISPKAAASTPGSVFWLAPDLNFWTYNGSVAPVECLVRDRLFGNVNQLQVNKIFAAVDANWNEVWWFYPSLNSTEIDSYVKHNYVERVWDYGSLARTAWESPDNFAYPMAADPNSLLFNHELGVDADGMPMGASAQTGYVMLVEGEQIVHIERLIPDFSTFAGPLAITVFAVDYPMSGALTQYGPYTVTPGSTPYVIVRARNRAVALKIESNTLGGNFRMGNTRALVAPAGRR